jgi:transposase
MSRKFKTPDYEVTLNQTISLRKALPPSHLARFVEDIVALLDLSANYTRYAPVGGEALAPEILLGLLFYAYATGLFSSRKIERATYESIPVRFVASGLHPDHDTIAHFRKTFLAELQDLLVQILLLAQAAQVLKLGKLSIDGSKIHADASKSHAVSYKRLLELEVQLRQEVSELLTLSERAYSFIKSQIEKGRQAFIICPLVEESDKIEAKAAIEEHARLQKEIFPQLKLGLMHGRLKPNEKDTAMRAFANNETQILVSTSVVEAGIDVPNATLILIEGAELFGLAQLHQFRGRVGRGSDKSYCLLQTDAIASDISERLKAVESSTDGFVLAEKDLELRGPGQFFGTRQSGLPDLHMINVTDARLIDLARREAEKILSNDPQLTAPDHKLIAQQLDEFWKSGQGDLS